MACPSPVARKAVALPGGSSDVRAADATFLPAPDGDTAAETGADGAALPPVDAAAPAEVESPDTPAVDDVGASDTSQSPAPGPPCGSDADCINDSWCGPDSGTCQPYGPAHPQKLGCEKFIEPGVFSPALQCEWTGPPAGDPFPANFNVLSTPLVVDFNFLGVSTGGGQIVFVSYAGTDGGFPSGSCCGVIRILDGATCTQLHTLGDVFVVGGATPAIGDLDLAPDGRAEIVAFRDGGGLVAFKYDEESAKFEVMWTSADTFAGAVNRWNGVVLADLAGDAHPEILFEGAVYDWQGNQLTTGLGWLSNKRGTFPVVADLDMDGQPEVLFGATAHRFDPATSSYVKESYVVGTPPLVGLNAVADFGPYGIEAGLPATAAEVVVVAGGKVTVYDLTGAVVFGPLALVGGGAGGPPTIGDFDNDGSPEIAAAGLGAYTIFDPVDCVADAFGDLPADCQSLGVRWASSSQDQSSSVTGSSVFDFEGDGQAEAIYADECFTRVYDGLTGEVLFSGARSSCTWHENPIVADVDGDFRSEIVVGSNTNCDIQCSGVDPVHPGLSCDDPTQCLSGVCEAGRCQCAGDVECPEGNVCTVPLSGPGQVCRATAGGKISGIRVFRDATDRWVHSRPIWNQHPYFITNVSDHGRIPSMAEAQPSWLTSNSFRQNAQGEASPLSAPDLTAAPADPPVVCGAGVVSSVWRVCNRGIGAVAPGIPWAVYAGSPGDKTQSICTGLTDTYITPGTCAQVECPIPSSPAVLWLSVDDADAGTGAYLECLEGNNVGTLLATCPE